MDTKRRHREAASAGQANRHETRREAAQRREAEWDVA